MAADRTPNDLADALDRLQNSYIAKMADGHNSIIVRTKDEELAECYRLMRKAAALLRRQAEQLDTLRNAVQQNVDWLDGTSETMHPMSTHAVANSLRDALAAAGGGVPEEGATDE